VLSPSCVFFFLVVGHAFAAAPALFVCANSLYGCCFIYKAGRKPTLKKEIYMRGLDEHTQYVATVLPEEELPPDLLLKVLTWVNND
jgi:hypothetical protein